MITYCIVHLPKKKKKTSKAVIWIKYRENIKQASGLMAMTIYDAQEKGNS